MTIFWRLLHGAAWAAFYVAVWPICFASWVGYEVYRRAEERACR